MNKNILNKKMTRKEFLLFGISLFIAISGISRIQSILSNTSHTNVTGRSKKGFGSNPYGV